MDGEVDAFLILALSVYVTPEVGPWVLAIGAARYLYLAGTWSHGWMRRELPPRNWRRPVAAVQGITLTVVAADVLPLAVEQAALAVALALLAESFGRDVLWLWRRREPEPAAAAPAPARGRAGAALGVALTVLALVLVWAALAAPNEPADLSAAAFMRLPLEVVVIVALALLLPPAARRAVAWVVGPLLGLLVLVKALDYGFYTAFDRPFEPVDDWRYGAIGIETLRASIGSTTANLALVGLALLLAALLVLPALAVLRLTRVAADRPRRSLAAVVGLAAIWAACWGLGAQLVDVGPVASTSTSDLAVGEVRAVRAGLRDRATFEGEIRRDDFRYAPGSRLLTDLRGKDVLVVFVESYGRVALEGSSFSDAVVDVVDGGTRDLAAAGFASRSGWLTSPTFGGISWLAHSTLQSGVWVDSQGRYDQVAASERFTLSQAFRRAGWRTVGMVPANDRAWPEGESFYRYSRVYDRRHVGYEGPGYSYAPMPDQYVLEALQRLELAQPGRGPLFAEVDLVSSHTPWTRIPPLIDWDELGDGSVFDELPVDTSSLSGRKAAYGRSIEYSLRAVLGFVQRYATDDTVVVLLGDHQPNTTVTGHEASHDVPISIIARDPAVLDDIDDWGWVDGLRPGPTAAVWPMSDFRDRFLTAFGSRP
jgi:hypothetical protein